MKDLAGRTAVVTGAGSGIGEALARLLASEGMRVAVLDIDADAAQRVAGEIGDSALAISCDVSDAVSVAAAVETSRARFGPPALLVANAGVTAFETFAEMSELDVDWIYHVNLLGVSRLIRAALPAMIAAGQGGHIVATSSMAGLVPTWAPIHVPYTATKAGILGLMMNLRGELAEHGIGCTTLCPGGVSTNIIQAQSHRPDRFGGASDQLITPPAKFRRPSAEPVDPKKVTGRTPAAVAQMVLQAVRAERPLVVTDSGMRGLFEDYAKLVLDAFDQAAAFEAEAPPPPP